jgi:hypothetical protein
MGVDNKDLHARQLPKLGKADKPKTRNNVNPPPPVLGWDKHALCFEEFEENGGRCTRGLFRFPEGVTFEGVWNNDLMHGTGKLVLSNGDIYEGFFESNEIHSKMNFFVGLTFSDDKSWYKGSWAQDLKAKDGTLRVPSGASYVSRLTNGEDHNQKRISHSL